MANQDLALDNTFRALADPTRRAVLKQLAEGPASVKDLAAPFEMALPSFMQHLRTLEQSGLVSSKKVGRTRTCAMEPAALAPVADWIAERKAVWEARFERLDAYLNDLESREET